MRKAARLDLVVILILALIAAFFRFYRLNELPIGLWRDEAANGLEALRVLEGDLAVFYGTQEPLFIYLVAISIALLGRNPLAIRMVAAVAGTATIPVTYLLVKELLRSTHQRARAVAFLTSLWLATSYWHLNFSRLGFRGVLLPLFAALSFYFLWRGWNQLDSHPSQRSTYVWLALAGSCFGVTFYTYTPSRFLPLLLIPFLILAARRTWMTTRAAAPMRRALSLNVPVFAALSVFVLSFVVILGPLALHFLADPQSLWVRFGVSVFGADTGEPLPVLLALNVLRQLGMFGFLADPNTRHNPAGRPAFDLITLGFFVIGFLLSLRRWRKTPYLFCIVWFLLMQMPAILTYPELPHSLRAIGALPIAYIFPALGLVASWEWLRDRAVSLQARSGLAVALGLCLTLSAGLSFRDYFAPQVEEIELVKAFDPRFVEIASAMNEFDDPDAVW
ncbi:MAG: glycosyltransferase family 39 protein, partial [Anaerolineae bacterium]|nr:glycosyltransferase family 39 protein [Anaerolineae bacterium]